MTQTLKKILLSCVACLVVGYAFGRFSAPDKVVEVETVKTLTVEKEDTKAREQVKELLAENIRLKQHVRRERISVTRPDGTTETRETETVDTDRTSDARKERDEVREVEVVRSIYVRGEKTKEIRVERIRPEWRIGALGVVDFHQNKVGAGAIVERRILGPVSIGLWGVSTGQGGLALTLEF